MGIVCFVLKRKRNIRISFISVLYEDTYTILIRGIMRIGSSAGKDMFIFFAEASREAR